MDIFAAGNAVLGGLGLFLVGMWLMGDGLKLAAGNTLRDILYSWTNTRTRALGTGFMITGLVQSSSAITVTTIGFANAGLLTLEQAIWVIFGSNLGTTMTGWIVALVGFKVNIEYFALPLIGTGMILRLTGIRTRRAAIGQAIAGFGLFFLGISVLKTGFIDHFSGYTLPGMEDAGLRIMLLYMFIGIMLTTLMQSSSAAMVITLGAAESGLVPLTSAAAVVIGANLGTTTTAILAVLGATSTAKRVAASHVFFNLITAAIAIIIVAPILNLIALVQTVLYMSSAPAVTLALFHTAFNLLGVLLMWPMSQHMVSILQRWFVSAREVASRPMYLDVTSLQVPAVAIQTLLKELTRTRTMVLQYIQSVISMETDTVTDETSEVEQLTVEIGKYVARLSREDLPENIAQSLPMLIQVAQQYALLEDMCKDYIDLQTRGQITDEQISTALNLYKHLCIRLLATIDTLEEESDMTEIDGLLKELEQEYEALKFQLLKAGSEGKLGMVTVDARLQQANLLRRIGRQAVKATHRLRSMHNLVVPVAESGKPAAAADSGSAEETAG